MDEEQLNILKIELKKLMIIIFTIDVNTDYFIRAHK